MMLLLVIGLLGMLASTTLFPVLVPLLFGSILPRIKSVDTEDRVDERFRVSVAIPTCGELSELERTLQSVTRARDFALRHLNDGALSVDVLVGFDGTHPAALALAKQFGVRTIVTPQRRGKWRMLKRLTRASRLAPLPQTEDWTVFADVGVVWPKDFLLKIVETARQSELCGIAPAYQLPQASLAQRSVWKIESCFKRLENRSGGPIAIHGPTVAYRSSRLERAFLELGEEEFINDDIVIPLMMRSLFPDEPLLYAPELVVTDYLTESDREIIRRRRMVRGNVAWVSKLLPVVWRKNRAVAVLSLRRVARMMWGYWLLSCVIGALLSVAYELVSVSSYLSGIRAVLFSDALIVATAMATTIALLQRGVLASACRASLEVPFVWLRGATPSGGAWK